MAPTRRTLLGTGGSLLASLAIAGCTAGSDGSDGGETNDGAESGDSSNDETDDESATGIDAAVAAEWNAFAARVGDAYALGRAGDATTGARVAGQTFERFETAGGDNGAHEMLEATSQADYEAFEEALGELRTEGLAAGNVERAGEEATIAADGLAAAQEQLAGTSGADALALQRLGLDAADVRLASASGAHDAASAIAAETTAEFEDAAVHDALDEADADAYEEFEAALGELSSAADDDDVAGVATAAVEAFERAIDGSYALAGEGSVASAGHVAALQALGWDAAALASLGGPPTAFAHAVTLSTYRARIADLTWLVSGDATDHATSVAQAVFEHFEGADAHDALESADAEAYESFETGLSELQSAIESGAQDDVPSAIETIDGALATGTEALAGGDAPLLGAGFFRARFADAREQYRLGNADRAAGIAESLFERFEADELGLHESIEETNESLYHRFEEEHLAGLVDAYGNGDDDAIATHHEAVQSALLEYESIAGSEATASGAEATFVAARGFDAGGLAALGHADRAAAIGQSTFEHFEAGAAGYHEALEHADDELYETFEERLGAITSAAESGEPVGPAAREFGAAAIDSAYAIVAAAGGDYADAAGAIVEDAFAHFEDARVHDVLEEADTQPYEAFEAALNDLSSTIAEGSDVSAAAASFADAALRAEFAVAGAIDAAPVDDTGSGDGESDPSLSGGPNVVDGVTDDADHVVDMTAVDFEPADLAVSVGDTVAWTHAGGEPHTVTAREGEIPADAPYWASGGFGTESDATEGWENGEGAVQSGQSYVHTFETAGTHAYYCIPHDAAGMEGTITIE